MGPRIATHAGLRGRPGIDLTPAVVADAVGGLAALLEDRDLPPRSCSPGTSARQGRRWPPRCVRRAGGRPGRRGPRRRLHARRKALPGAPRARRRRRRDRVPPRAELNGLKLVAGEPPCPSIHGPAGARPAPRTGTLRTSRARARPRRRCRGERGRRGDPRRPPPRDLPGGVGDAADSRSPTSGSHPVTGRGSCWMPMRTASGSKGSPPTASWCSRQPPGTRSARQGRRHHAHRPRARGRNRRGPAGELTLSKR